MPTTRKSKPKPRGRPPLSDAQMADMRAQILNVARRVFLEEGYEAVSMRRIASEVGCAPMTLYSYYDSKVDVLRGLWADVFAELFGQLHALKPRKDTRASLRAKCQAYVRFWMDRPETYRLVFMTGGVTQSEVSVFAGASATAEHYAIFTADLALAADRPEGAVMDHAQALVCGLNGIAHNLITISGYAWARSDKLVAILVDGVVAGARAS